MKLSFTVYLPYRVEYRQQMSFQQRFAKLQTAVLLYLCIRMQINNNELLGSGSKYRK